MVAASVSEWRIELQAPNKERLSQKNGVRKIKGLHGSKKDDVGRDRAIADCLSLIQDAFPYLCAVSVRSDKIPASGKTVIELLPIVQS
jgi:hypothetical protein